MWWWGWYDAFLEEGQKERRGKEKGSQFSRIAISRAYTKFKKPSSRFPSKMPEPSSTNNRTDHLHALLRSRAVMERLGRSATFADVKRIGFLTDPEPAGGLAVSASYTEAALRAGRTSLGVRLSDWITRRTVSQAPFCSCHANKHSIKLY